MAILSSQAAVTTVKIINEYADGIIKFFQNLSSGYLPIDIVCDSYFDNSLKLHAHEACSCGQFFPFTEAINIPKDFQGNFLKHSRNKVAWTHLWQVSCWCMILVLLLYSFLWTRRLNTILQPLAKKIFILDGYKRTLIQKSLSTWNIVFSVVSEMLQFKRKMMKHCY